MSVIGIIDIIIKGDNAPLNKALGNTSNKLKSFHSDLGKIGDPLAAIGSKATSAFANLATGIGGAIVGFFAIKHAISEVKGQFAEVSDMFKKSGRLGLDVNQFEAYGLAAKKAGMDGEGMVNALNKMRKAVSEAQHGNKEKGDLFKELGLDPKKLANQSTDEQFKAIMEAQKGMGSGDKLRIDTKLFGREGGAGIATGTADWLKALDDAEAKARKYGLALSDLDASKITLANAAMKEMGLATEGVWRQITLTLAPDVSAAFGMINDSIAEGGAFTELIGDLVSAFGDICVLVIGNVVSVWQDFQSVVYKVYGGICLVMSKIPGMGKEWADTAEFMFKKSDEMFKEAQSNDGMGALNKYNARKQASKDKAAEALKNRGKIIPSAEVDEKVSGQALVDKLGQQISVFGMTSRAAEIYEAAIKGASEEELVLMRGMDRLLSAKEVARDYYDSLPINKLTKETALYTNALQQGAITGDVFEKLLKKQKDDILGFNDPMDKLNTRQEFLQKLLEKGTINFVEYSRAMKEATNSAFGLAETPVDKLETFAKTLANINTLFANGLISADKYWATYNKGLADQGVVLGPERQNAEFQSKADAIDKIRGSLTGKEYADSMKKALPDFVQSLMASTETPMEKFKREMDNLKSWKDAGMSTDLYNRGVQKARGDLMGHETRFGAAMDFGSQEARTMALQNKYGDPSKDATLQIVDYTKQQVDKQAETIVVLNKIANKKEDEVVWRW